MPRPTTTQTHTPKPTATMTSTPTAVPAIVPDDWLLYSHFAREFHVYHPPTWKVSDEGPHSVSFDAPGSSGATVGIYRTNCVTGEANDDAILTCFAVEAADSVSSLDTFRLVDKDIWNDGYHHGYWVVFDTKDYVYGVWSAHVWVSIPVGPRRILGATYYHVGRVSESIANQETQMFVTLVRSIRMGSGPAPRVAATPTDTSVPTPTPFTAPVGATLESKGYTIRVVEARLDNTDRARRLADATPKDGAVVAILLEVTPKQKMDDVDTSNAFVDVTVTNEAGGKVGWSSGVQNRDALTYFGLEKRLWYEVGQTYGIGMLFPIPNGWKGPLYLTFRPGWYSDALEGLIGKRVNLNLTVE